jgi:hypothetical protein
VRSEIPYGLELAWRQAAALLTQCRHVRCEAVAEATGGCAVGKMQGRHEGISAV